MCSSLRSKRFCGVREQRIITARKMERVKEGGGGGEGRKPPLPPPSFSFLVLAPFSAQTKHRTSRSSVFLCFQTPRKRLLRRLRQLHFKRHFKRSSKRPYSLVNLWQGSWLATVLKLFLPFCLERSVSKFIDTTLSLLVATQKSLCKRHGKSGAETKRYWNADFGDALNCDRLLSLLCCFNCIPSSLPRTCGENFA